jgi:hypothetical protein
VHPTERDDIGFCSLRATFLEAGQAAYPKRCLQVRSSIRERGPWQLPYGLWGWRRNDDSTATIGSSQRLAWSLIPSETRGHETLPERLEANVEGILAPCTPLWAWDYAGC